MAGMIGVIRDQDVCLSGGIVDIQRGVFLKSLGLAASSMTVYILPSSSIGIVDSARCDSDDRTICFMQSL